MMIFATVGTHGQRFDRLLAALERLPAPGEVVVQYGVGEPPRRVREAAADMSFEEVGRHIETAEVVISHAGVGSILRARDAGHVPVVMPRLARLGEHVDDHQVELAEALTKDGAVVPVWPGDELAPKIDTVPPRTAGDANRAASWAPLVSAVGRAVAGDCEGRRGRWRSGRLQAAAHR
jgi:UDP-N-acetylglucosamine transferase subunit ALG13